MFCHRPMLSAARYNCSKNLRILQPRRFYFPAALAVGRVQVPLHSPFSLWKSFAGVGVGLGLSIMLTPPILCEGSEPTTPRSASPVAPESPDANPEMPPLPESSVNIYELSFGTVAGICAGVFIKKGAKTLAFLLGGVFVLLQYFGSFGVVKVDWEKMGSRFQSMFYTTDPKTGTKTAPTIYSAWRWLVDFLTADFQPRASFLAGLALGLRIG